MTRRPLALFLLTLPALSLAAARLAGETTPLDLARLELRRDRLPQAISSAEQAVRLEPARSEAHHVLAKAYGLSAKRAALLTQLSLAKKCRAELARAVALDPGNLDAALDLVRYDVRAPGFIGGSRKRARAFASALLARNAARGHAALGLVHEAEKAPLLAEREFRAALEADPLDPAALDAFVDFMAAAKRYDEAFRICGTLADAHPEHARVWYEIGLLAVRSGKEIDRGLAALDRFLALPARPDGPDYADARFRKGELLARRGEPDAARAEYRAALELEPGHAGAAAALSH